MWVFGSVFKQLGSSSSSLFTVVWCVRILWHTALLQWCNYAITLNFTLVWLFQQERVAMQKTHTYELEQLVTSFEDSKQAAYKTFERNARRVGWVHNISSSSQKGCRKQGWCTLWPLFHSSDPPCSLIWGFFFSCFLCPPRKIYSFLPWSITLRSWLPWQKPKKKRFSFVILILFNSTQWWKVSSP